MAGPQALFRPVSMCVPDLNLICEIMLMAEGFQQSKALSRKFVILYKLCEDLLSKSRHYDWKLRAIKTTLYVAGSMKRQAPELSEDKVLCLSAEFALVRHQGALDGYTVCTIAHISHTTDGVRRQCGPSSGLRCFLRSTLKDFGGSM